MHRTARGPWRRCRNKRRRRADTGHGDGWNKNSGDGFAIDLGREVMPALGGSLVNGPDEQVEIGGDLSFEFFPAEFNQFDAFHRISISTHTFKDKNSGKTRTMIK